jgi:hypothetical protein
MGKDDLAEKTVRRLDITHYSAVREMNKRKLVSVKVDIAAVFALTGYNARTSLLRRRRDPCQLILISLASFGLALPRCFGDVQACG